MNLRKVEESIFFPSPMVAILEWHNLISFKTKNVYIETIAFIVPIQYTSVECGKSGLWASLIRTVKAAG